MKASHTATMEPAELQTPVRNRYFYGKLLDVYHCELETNYLNTKRWLLNRLVTGSGVVCGLNVECGQEPNKIVITPGVAIDRWGREIVIPKETAPITIPPDVLYDAVHSREYEHGKNGPSLHVLLCYHECDSDPVPVLAGDCDSTSNCEAGLDPRAVPHRVPAGRAATNPSRVPDSGCDLGRQDRPLRARALDQPAVSEAS